MRIANTAEKEEISFYRQTSRDPQKRAVYTLLDVWILGDHETVEVGQSFPQYPERTVSLIMPNRVVLSLPDGRLYDISVSTLTESRLQHIIAANDQYREDQAYFEAEATRLLTSYPEYDTKAQEAWHAQMTKAVNTWAEVGIPQALQFDVQTKLSACQHRYNNDIIYAVYPWGTWSSDQCLTPLSDYPWRTTT